MISEDIFKVSNHEATIPILAKEHQGLKVRCLAIQKLTVGDKFNTTTTDVHELTVDVWCKSRKRSHKGEPNKF